MSQLAITDELAATLVRRRPGRRTYRTDWMPLDDFLQCVDVAACREIYAEAAKHRGEYPCKHMNWPPKECSKPKPHQTCDCPCWTFRSCKNPDCDHPACGREVDRLFSDVFKERFPDLADVDVLIERTEVPMKLGAGGLYLRSFADMARDKRCAKPNIELGKRMWSKLTEEWVDPRDLGVGQDDVTAAEMGMWKLKLPVEQSGVRYQYGFWVAYSLAQGEEITGGTHFNEIRRKPGSKDRRL